MKGTSAVTTLIGTAWRAAPMTLLWAFTAATVGAVASAAFPLGFHYMVDGALAHRSGEVTFGVALVAILFSVATTLTTLSVTGNWTLTDRLNLFVSGRIALLLSTAPRLEHFEHRELLSEIDQLRNDRRSLAAAPRQLLRAWQVVIRGGAIMLLLATVYPPVMLMPLFGLIPALADRRAGRVQARTGDELAPTRRLIGDLFTLATTAETAKELRTYGVTDALAARHATLAEEARRRDVRGAIRAAAWEALGWVGYAAAFVGVIIVLVLRAAHGHTSPGQVVMAVSLMRRAQRQVAGASDTAGSLARAVRTARRLAWLEDYVAEETRAPGRTPVPDRLRTGIRLEGVGFRYPGSDEDVLSDLTVDLPAGATVAIVGENGAGKTTLVKLLTGMYRPTDGRILADGADLAGLSPDEWRARTTAVFQDFVRPNLVAREAVGIGDLPRIEDEAAVRSALAAAGADGLPSRLADGLATPLGRWFTGGQELSGGQWQRIALARGLMRADPLLTVLDEPTAAMDPAAEAELFTRFAALARAGRRAGGITLLVSHRFSTARTADLIIVLQDGRITEAGDHETLLARGGGYAELFTLQAKAYEPG
ncbi:ABC transporter ATP-binding protein [Actinoallomurus rhizosphaericola]|uniref:ABC transporter ATP-binding protein n=1 Tax=Actinoallomurus rhizosphaericola TaxID=2952536 RepID=UPI00209319F5|nr:ATP-binding cassette domain-containing protein [Actinoallomurus rhizosphaericola]MCO5995147.1 ABC transporter ATP-binding protein/permease [Actinoallomurus rhizosphaericola]